MNKLVSVKAPPSKTLLLIIFTLANNWCVAQTNFLKGYYVTNADDTVRGYIEYTFEDRNFKFFVFRSDLKARSVRLYPGDAKAFALDDKLFYESQSYTTSSGEVLSGFYKVAFKGRLSLYKYKSRYFAQEKGEQLVEISKQQEIVEGNKLRSNYTGLGILKAMMQDCEIMKDGFLEAHYKGNPDFEYIFERYYRCMGEPARRSTRPGIGTRTQLGLIVGAALHEPRFTEDLESATFDSEIGYRIGGYASIFFPGVDERFRLVVEATYSRFDGYSFFKFHTTNNDLFVKYSSLSIPIIVRYNPNRFLIDVGLQSQFILNQDVRWRIETVGTSVVSTTEGDVARLGTNSHGLLVGVGYRVGRVRSSIRYMQSSTSKHPHTPTYHSLEFLVSYEF